MPKPEAPAASTIIISFFLMLLVFVLLGCIAQSCGRDEDLKRARQEDTRRDIMMDTGKPRRSMACFEFSSKH